MKNLILLVVGFISATTLAIALDRTVTGTVTDKDGNGLAGVVIQAKGSTVGTFSKGEGKYKIVVPGGTTTLVFKIIGKRTTEVQLGTSDEVNVALDDDALRSDEVVVTAIGIERQRKSLGYATQEIESQEIINSRETNIVNAIASRVAGVQVNNSAGVPGASSFIRIRGSSSISGNNQPLFVIDGIPIDNSQLYSGNPDNLENNLLEGVAYSNRAIDIDPSTVASMNVLKGPAAVALYGIRAAGGAIIITTKKGAPTIGDKVNIQYNTSWSIDQVNKLPELQMKYSQGSGGNYQAPAPGAARSWGALIDTLYWDGNSSYKWDKNGMIVGKSDPTARTRVAPYDNPELFFRTGLTSSNGINMFGGDETATYFVSFSNLTSNGVVPLSSWSRNSFKVSGSSAIASNFRASANLNYVASGGTRIQQGSNTSGVMLGLTRTPPTFDNSNGFGQDAADEQTAYKFADGTQRTYRGGVGYDNPFWTANQNPFKDKVSRFFGNVQFDWSLIKNVDLMYRLGVDFYSDRRKQQIAINSRTAPAGRVFDDQWYNEDITSDLILTLNFDLGSDMALQVLVGNNLYSTYTQQLYVQGDGLGAADFYHISNTSGQITRESVGRKRTAAFYADARYSYKDALFINVTGRNEWSTSLPVANNSFFYPSISTSLVLTQLFPDMQSDVLSFVQVRGNLAQVGNDAPIYGTASVYTQAFYGDGWTDGISFPYSGTIGFMKADVLGNPDLRPEKTNSVEVGFDVRLLDNRIGVDFTWYNQVSKDQIFQVPTAASSGFLAQLKNAGSIQNSGVEIVLTATPLLIDEFRWDISFNFTKNNIQVLELAPGVDNITLGGFVGSSVRAVAGLPYGTIFGFGWLRNQNGDIIIDDDPSSSNYGYPILDTKEKAFGSANPDWLLGIRNTFMWMNFSLSAVLDIRQGGVVWNGTRGALYYFGTHKDTEIRGTTKVFDGVKQSNGQANDIEAALDENWLSLGNGNGFYGSNTEDFIEDASWVRLREVTLSYTFPSSIMKSTPISGLVLSFTGRNLWLSTNYTGVDPETSLTGASNAQGIDYFNMPSTRSFVFAATLNF